MSRQINVNPGQYKVAGRERQGEDIVHERQKAQLSRERAKLERARQKPKARAKGSKG